MPKVKTLIARALAIAGTQSNLAHILSTTPSHVSEWINGARPVPDHHLWRLAQLVGDTPKPCRHCGRCKDYEP
jgi:DNA-binding transcriptional regulator YdaS (Cro superfamily)